MQNGRVRQHTDIGIEAHDHIATRVVTAIDDAVAVNIEHGASRRATVLVVELHDKPGTTKSTRRIVRDQGGEQDAFTDEYRVGDVFFGRGRQIYFPTQESRSAGTAAEAGP